MPDLTFPVPSDEDSVAADDFLRCRCCGRVLGETQRFVRLTSGVMVEQESQETGRTPLSTAPNPLMTSFISLWYHGPHPVAAVRADGAIEIGTGNKECSFTAARTPARPGGQVDISFCSADCLRSFFDQIVRAFQASITQQHIEGAAAVCTRMIFAPRERVFSAISDPSKLARWWGPKGFTSTFSTFEFTPGGRWLFTMHSPDGRDFPNESTFAVIDAPARVVIHHVSAPKFALTIDLDDFGNWTQVRWRQEFESPEVCAKLGPIVVPSNEQNLDRLQDLVQDPLIHK